MKQKAMRILTAAQRALPNATVFWEKEPDSGPVTDLCILAAVSRSDKTKRVSRSFLNGLGDHPEDETVDVFVNDVRTALP